MLIITNNNKWKKPEGLKISWKKNSVTGYFDIGEKFVWIVAEYLYKAFDPNYFLPKTQPFCILEKHLYKQQQKQQQQDKDKI